MDIRDRSIYSRYTTSMLLVKYMVTFFLIYRPTKLIAIWLMKVAIKKNIKIITKVLNGIYFGGETLREAKDAIHSLAKNSISSVLDYAVEGEQDESFFDETVLFTLKAIDLASQDINIPYVVIKPTSIGSSNLYQARVSRKSNFECYLPLWEKLLSRYEKIFSYAQQKSVAVMIDAEQSWIQTAVNEIAIEKMLKYNSEYALITMTLQCYRRDSYELIMLMNTLATNYGITVGIKLVRGAYLEEELKFNAHSKALFFSSQSETDKNYNFVLDYIFENINNFHPFIATHNQTSINKVLNNPLSSNKKVWLAQLYGVGDHLSLAAVKKGAQVCKYLPYGPFRKSFPYLMRRIEENAVSRETFRMENTLIKEELTLRMLRKK